MFFRKYHSQNITTPSSSSPSSLWWDFFQKNKLSFSLGIFSIALCTITQVSLPRFIGFIINGLKGDGPPQWATLLYPTQPIYALGLLYLVLSFSLMFFRMGWRATLARSSHRASCWLKKLIWNKAVHMPRELLTHHYDLGTLMNLSNSDVNSARFLFGFTLIAMIDVLFLGTLSLVSMAFIDIDMMLLTLLLLPIMPIFIKKLAAQESLRYSEAQRYLSRFNELCAQAVKTVKMQRLTQTTGLWDNKLNNSADQYRDRNFEAHRASLRFYPAMGLSSLFSYSILFSIGIYKTLQGEMSAGEFVALQGLVLLIQDPLVNLGYYISEWQRASTSLSRLAKLFNQNDAEIFHRKRNQEISQDSLTPVIEVKNLSFRHQMAKQELFSKLSFCIKKQERLGILGPIGTGKSTLLHLLMGEYPVGQGKIKIYGVDLNKWGHKDITERMVHLPQRPFLFASTIRENVKVDLQMNDQKVWELLKVASLDQDVKEMPEQLDTPLGEWGVNLSGGQKQRLGLARVLARRPEILLLDDCLSAVDTVTEEKILKRLDNYLCESTLIWVAHRSSTLKYCDRIMELKHE